MVTIPAINNFQHGAGTGENATAGAGRLAGKDGASGSISGLCSSSGTGSASATSSLLARAPGSFASDTTTGGAMEEHRCKIEILETVYYVMQQRPQITQRVSRRDPKALEYCVGAL